MLLISVGLSLPLSVCLFKVLLSGDGSLRVEFMNSRGLENELGSAPLDSTLRDSKGSSISSEESWYDSPWGAGSDLCDSVFSAGRPSDDSSGYTTLSSCPPAPAQCRAPDRRCLEDDSGVGDLFHIQDSESSCFHNSTGPFPPVRDGDATGLHGGRREMQQGSDGPRLASGTCSRKDSLKSRIGRLSDWTGSLSRKKRRLQVRRVNVRTVCVGGDFQHVVKVMSQ